MPKKFPEEIYPLCEKGQHFSMLSAGELVQDACGFLKRFYRGCYNAYVTHADHKNVLICIENFAIVIKSLIKAVFGRQTIIIAFNNEDEHLCIDFKLHTDYVSDELREEIRNLASSGGFSIDFYEEFARVKIKYIHNSIPYVNAFSTRIVYKIMSYILHSKLY